MGAAGIGHLSHFLGGAVPSSPNPVGGQPTHLSQREGRKAGACSTWHEWVKIVDPQVITKSTILLTASGWYRATCARNQSVDKDPQVAGDV